MIVDLPTLAARARPGATTSAAARVRAARAACGAGGHTLAELLVVLGLAAIATSLAVPTFRDLGANVRRDAVVEELRASLLLARTEAVSRGVPVVVCPSLDGRACRPDPAWSRGWLVLERDAADGNVQPLASVRVTGPVDVRATRASVEFQPTASAGTTATFSVCDERGAPAARAVIVSRTGRVRVARTEARCG